MKAAEFAQLVKGARQRSNGWWDARCPAHDDGKPSLSFRDGDRGLILKCQAPAGCTAEAIAQAVGKRLADLFPSNGSTPGGRAAIVATYDYTDAAGVLRYQVVRFEPKDFRCRRPDGDGWTWNMQGVGRLPYRLPELAEASRVYAPEGERDVDSLRAVGLIATCNEGGAGKWRDEHTAALVAAAVPELVILPDHDAAGEDHARKVAHAALCAGLRVKIVRLPDLPPKGDVSDYLGAGHTPSELEALADAAPVLSLADVTDDPRPSDQVGPAVMIRPATLGEILAVDPGELVTTFIAEPWIPEGGLTALTAKPGVGKGKLAQDLCLARASGGTWLGVRVKPGPALFWSAEQGKREDFRVTQALCRGRGLKDAGVLPYFFGIIYDPPLRLSEPRMLEQVLALAHQHPGLLVAVDSLRRSFAGEDRGSDVADAFYSTVIVPLRTQAATVVVLAHPPKTTGQQRRIDDENMVRGSGDFVAQLDSLLVLRPVDRTRHDATTETIVTRLKHAKARGSAEAPPHLVSMHVTNDRTPLVTFTLSAKETTGDDGAAAVAGATKAIGLLFEEKKRLSRRDVVETLKDSDHGRPACEAALKKLVDLGVIHGPLTSEEKRKGERGHWFVFVKPLPTQEAADDGLEAADDPGEDPDEL